MSKLLLVGKSILFFACAGGFAFPGNRLSKAIATQIGNGISSRSMSLSSIDGLTYINATTSKAVDDRLMVQPGFSIDQLMELAGYSVACASFDYQQRYVEESTVPHNVLIFCGPGNNGGDGLVAARHLKHFGYRPTVVYPKFGKGQLFANLVQQIKDLNIPILEDVPSMAEYHEFNLVIDSLFGFSFKGPSREPYSSMIQLFSSSKIPVISVDIPSGWDVDKGDIYDTKHHPQAVISLTVPKLCMKDYSGVHYVGGRFVPPQIAAELGLSLPDYGIGDKQFVDITTSTHTSTCTPTTTVAAVATPTIVGKSEIGPSSNDKSGIVAMFVTTGSREEAKIVAQGLVRRKLVACVNIIPHVESVYEWDGQIEESQEFLLMIKVRRNQFYSINNVIYTPACDSLTQNGDPFDSACVDILYR